MGWDGRCRSSERAAGRVALRRCHDAGRRGGGRARRAPGGAPMVRAVRRRPHSEGQPMSEPINEREWPQAALFDLDGTLMDREPLMVEAVARALQAAGSPMEEHELGTSVGRAWTDVYALLDIESRYGWDFD